MVLNVVAGDADRGYGFRQNVSALGKGEYLMLGKLIATMLAQGGEAPRIFLPSTVDAILETDICSDLVHDIVETDKRMHLEKVKIVKINMKGKLCTPKSRYMHDMGTLFTSKKICPNIFVFGENSFYRK